MDLSYRNTHYTRYGFTMDDPWADESEPVAAKTATGTTSPTKTPTSPTKSTSSLSKSPEPASPTKVTSTPTSPIAAEPTSPVKSPETSPKQSLDQPPTPSKSPEQPTSPTKSLEQPASPRRSLEPASPEKQLEELSLEDDTPTPSPLVTEPPKADDDAWGESATPPASAISLAPPPSTSAAGGFGDDGFGDDDGFGEPSGDDGFDDFGDSFAEPSGADDFGDFDDFEEAGFNPPPELPTPVAEVRTWHALSLRPVPPRRELALNIQDTLGIDSTELTDEEPRAVGGLSQVLVHESNRETYAQLVTPPLLKPLDWTRSRVRREHLIAMGVPVNLDEVESHRLTALPPLNITTDLASRPQPRVSEDKHGLGPKPTLDTKRAEELCALEEDQLKLLSLSKLEVTQRELVRYTNQASELLAYLAQLKDARLQDHETYNGMISELIANAAKAKAPSSSGAFGNRHSKRLSMSGNSTPRRTGSPMTR